MVTLLPFDANWIGDAGDAVPVVRVTAVPGETEYGTVTACPGAGEIETTSLSAVPSSFESSQIEIRIWVKVGVTVLFAVIDTVQLVPVAESQPDQPPNTDVASGDAVSVTDEPWTNFAEHVRPQSTPAGELVTVPPPVPAFWTVSENNGRNSAVTVLLTSIVTLQVGTVLPTQAAPPHDTNTPSVAGMAVRCTIVFAS